MKPAYKPNKYTPTEGRFPTECWGPFKYQWYSICSAHNGQVEDCSRCMVGEWINCWAHEIGSFIYNHDPILWRWWANRPALIPAAKRIFKHLTNKNAR